MTFFALGFRPFFLLGVSWSVIAMVIWNLFQMGKISLPQMTNPNLWHAHEMIFGYTMAIVAGFILTSTQTWSGKRGLHGIKLVLVVSLWASARFSGLILGQTSLIYILLDLCFIPVLIIALIPYLAIPTQKRNFQFLFVFGLLFLGNLLFHLGALDTLPGIARSALYYSLFLILVLIAVIGGRVIPFFTSRVVSPHRSFKNPTLEMSAIFSLLILGAGILLGAPQSFITSTAWIAFVLHLIRWLGWYPWQARSVPILIILYLGYFWMITGLLLFALTPQLQILPTLSVHALTVGALGVTIYAMITRVSLGHTARPIQANHWVVMGYGIINLAVLVRVIFPLILPNHYSFLIIGSGWLWVFAHLIFIIVYAPILFLPRLDNKPG